MANVGKLGIRVGSPKPDEPRVVARPRQRRFLTSKGSSRPERLRGLAEEQRELYLQIAEKESMVRL